MRHVSDLVDSLGHKYTIRAPCTKASACSIHFDCLVNSRGCTVRLPQRVSIRDIVLPVSASGARLCTWHHVGVSSGEVNMAGGR